MGKIIDPNKDKGDVLPASSQPAPAPKNEGPYGIVRHRIPEGTIRHGDRIVRYWKSKETGETVEVRRYLNVVPEHKKRIVFFDPVIGRELSCELADFKRDFEPQGNISDKF